MKKRLLWLVGVATVLISASIYRVMALHSNFSRPTKAASAQIDTETVSSQIGQLAIKPQFDAAASFINGLAAVRVGNEKTAKWGYISSQSLN